MSHGQPPVIIIGMHRSGTSMVTRLLEDMGLFIGTRTDKNHEAVPFLLANRWLMRKAGARWDRPEPVDELLAHPWLPDAYAATLTRFVEGPPSALYLGFRRYIKYRSLRAVDRPWGWKDPRNTYTLPVWLDVFPDSRVIHVTRHGVDVAQSLAARAARDIERSQSAFEQRPRRHTLGSLVGPLSRVTAADNLAGGLHLWDAYVTRAAEHVRQLGERAVTVRYEDVLDEPMSHLARLASHCGLGADQHVVQAAVERLEPARRYAFRENDELVAFSNAHAATIVQHGYQA